MTFYNTLKTVELLSPQAFDSYVNLLLETNTDEDGDKLSDYYEPYCIDESSLQTLWEECYQFLKQNSEAIHELTEAGHELRKILYDFCMTRNGSWAGFWDGDYPEPQATLLTNAAHKFNPVSLYVGDDGTVYMWNN